MRFHVFTASLLLSMMPLFATITNIHVGSPFDQNYDTLNWSCQSTSDTIRTYLYLDRTHPSSFSATEDTLEYPIAVIDQSSDQIISDSLYIFPDMDSTDDALLFKAPGGQLPQGLYWVRFFDGQSDVADSLRVIAKKPMRNVSGTLTLSPGVSTALKSVRAESQNYGESAYMDPTGNFTIVLDSSMVLDDQGSVKIRLADNYPGYIISPMDTTVDVSAGDVTGISFRMVAVPQGIVVTVLAGTYTTSNVDLWATDSATGKNYNAPRTDAYGTTSLFLPVGTYSIQFSQATVLGYFEPTRSFVHVNADQFVQDTLRFTAPDTTILGQLEVNGSPSGMNPDVLFTITDMQTQRSAYITPYMGGDIHFPAMKADSTYSIRVISSRSEYFQFNNGWVLEHDPSRDTFRLADSPVFNIISLSSGINFVLKAGDSVLSGVDVYVEDTVTHQMYNTVQTDNAGAAMMYLPAGFYRPYVIYSDIPGLLVPDFSTIRVPVDTTVPDTLTLVVPDTFIAGQITLSGGAPGGVYGFFIHDRVSGLSSQISATPDDVIRFPAMKADSVYNISLVTWDNRWDTLPEGYVFEGNPLNNDFHLRDSVKLNIVSLSTAAEFVRATPRVFALGTPRPSPFNPVVTLEYSVPSASQVSLRIYDLSGKLVTTLLNSCLKPGYKTVSWNGRNSQGRKVAAGLYILRMEAGKFSAIRRLMFMK